MDVFVAVLNGAFAAYAVNLSLAVAVGAYVLFLLARGRPARATVAADGR